LKIPAGKERGRAKTTRADRQQIERAAKKPAGTDAAWFWEKDRKIKELWKQTTGCPLSGFGRRKERGQGIHSYQVFQTRLEKKRGKEEKKKKVTKEFLIPVHWMPRLSSATKEKSGVIPSLPTREAKKI